MMPCVIILKVRKFHQSTINRFGTAGKKPVGGHNVPPPPPSLNRVKPTAQLGQLKRSKYEDERKF